MNILCVGNSFSVDVTTYFHQIAKSAGKTLNVGVLYIGGCPVKRHYDNIMNKDICDYEFYLNGRRIDDKFYNFFFGLNYMKWDYITFQQVSQESPFSETFFPELTLLMNEVRKYTDAIFILHRTWSYKEDYERYIDDMYNKIVNSYKEVSKISGIPYIIPSGDGIEIGEKKYHWVMHRDGFHLNEKGRTLTGLIWAFYFLGYDIDVSSFKPEGYSYDDITPPVSNEEYQILINIAKEVVNNNKEHNLIK